MQTQLEPIYTTPTGWKVFEFSHSQYSKYVGCGKRFEIERVRGWRQKPGAILEFGKAIEGAVKGFYVSRREPVENFERSWDLMEPTTLEGILREANEQPDSISAKLKNVLAMNYPNGESWQTMNVAGRALMKTFAATWEQYPPRDPFFPDFKRNPYKVRDAATGHDYQAVPDLIDKDAAGPFIVDLKSLGNLLDDSVPGLVVNDKQLRTYAAVTKIFRVALWNFCRKPKRGEALLAESIFEEVRKGVGGVRFQVVPHVALFAAREANGLNIDDAGQFLGIANPQEINKEYKKLCKEDPSLKVLAEEIARTLSESNAPQFKIQWLEGTMTEEHAVEAIREEMSVIPQIKAGWFPRRGGLRFPENTCTWCPARGLCMEELFGPKPEYDAITREEMVKYDANMMDGLD